MLFTYHRSYVTLPKSSNPDRILSNSQVFDFALDEHDMRKMDGLDEHLVTGWDPTIMS